MKSPFITSPIIKCPKLKVLLYNFFVRSFLVRTFFVALPNSFKSTPERKRRVEERRIFEEFSGTKSTSFQEPWLQAVNE